MKLKLRNAFNLADPNMDKPLILYLVVFVSFFDTHAQMPVLAPYAESLGATPFLVGLVIGTYSFFNITGNFSSGIWIDRSSWKLPLFGGLIGVSLILALYPLAESALSLVAIRAAHGYLGGILIPAALACLTVRSDVSDHKSRLALFGASIGLAAVTGPMFSGITAGRFGYQTVYFSLAIMMAIATAISALSLFRQAQDLCHMERPPVSFKLITGNPPLKSAYFFAFGTMGSTGSLASFLPGKASTLGLLPAMTGALFATFALSAIIVQILWPAVIRPIVKNDCRGAAFGLFFVGFALLIATRSSSILGIFIALALFGIGFGISFQGMLGLVISGSALEWRGRAIGLFFAVYSLGVALVPPFGGFIWQNVASIFPFYTAAAIAFVCAAAGILTSRT